MIESDCGAAARVRNGSFPDVTAQDHEVRFAAGSGRRRAGRLCRLRARSGGRTISFDQFVGRNENGLRHGEPHRLCGPRIDH